MDENKQLIISIGREYGSGGHEIAEKLAEKFDLPLYDYRLLGEIAEGKKIDIKTLERFDELPKVPFISRTVKGYSNSPQENIARLQFEFIKKKAEAGESFVIVGRCAETVLKGTPGLVSIFVLGDVETKLERIAKRENISRIQAEEKLAKHDRKRKNYHNRYCKIKWGDSRNYDLCINSSRTGIDGTVEILEGYIRRRQES